MGKPILQETFYAVFRFFELQAQYPQQGGVIPQLLQFQEVIKICLSFCQKRAQSGRIILSAKNNATIFKM